MPLRLFLPQPFASDSVLALSVPASRHVHVLRLQPGATVVLFNGTDGAEWPAEIVRIGRNAVDVRLGVARPVDRELRCAVTLAVGVPANDRMDALIEKAGELGARALQPLVCERSVLRLSGERAETRRVHWNGVAAAASEQCGRTRVTEVLALQSLAAWLEASTAVKAKKFVLSFDPAALPAPTVLDTPAAADRAARAIVVLSGPEGGLASHEEEAAVARGFERVSLGPRVLRADTAPLALLAWLALTAASQADTR